MAILKLKAPCKDYIWGGNRLREEYGKQLDSDRIAESWELSCHKDGQSVITGGEFDGKTLSDYIAAKGKGVLGKNCGRFEYFPVLIKLIDAKDNLSVQVHPSNEYALRVEGEYGKTEMWYVVSADKDAHLRSGFSKQVTPAEYEASVGDNTITDILADYKIAPGDVFFLPAGRVHSIGAGSFIAEIQQTSNITYRIYDFNRRDANGNTRELHTELAKGAIDYTVLPDYRTHYEPAQDTRVELVSCPYFTTSLYDLTRPETLDLASLDSFVVAICIEGCGTLTDDSGAAVPVHQGETVLIPASARSLAFTPDGGMKILTSWIG